MVIKVYISGICGSQDIRKQQQRVLFILSMLALDVEIIDVTEPGREGDRSFMQQEVKKHNKTVLLPPQIFNDKEYCGDYDDFQLAADDDVLMTFLKLEEPESVTNGHVEDSTVAQNGVSNDKTTEPRNLEAADDAKIEDQELAITGEKVVGKSEGDAINVVDNLSIIEAKAEDPKESPETAVAKSDEGVIQKTEEEEESSEEESEEEESD